MITTFKRQILISFSIIVGSVLVAIITLVYFTSAISTNAKKIASDRSLTDQQTGSLEVLADLKAQVPQATLYQTAMDKLLPTEDGLIGFANWVNTIAADHQVTASVSFDSQGTVVQPTGNVAGYTGFSIDATGSIQDLTVFLQDMELKTPGYFLQLTDFNLVDQNGSYELTGHGNLFFQ